MKLSLGLIAAACVACLSVFVTTHADNLITWEGYGQQIVYNPHTVVPMQRHWQADSVMPEDQNYDDSWQSIRTFRLTDALDHPLKVYVETNPQNGALYKPAYAEYVAQDLGMWSQALHGRLLYTFVDAPRKADITVSWVARFPEADQAGETSAKLGHASIEIMTPSIPDNLIKEHILHELGHALGIENHSENNDDTMVSAHEWRSEAEYRTYQAHLSQRDVLAIQRLYSLAWHPGEDLYNSVASELAHTKVAARN